MILEVKNMNNWSKKLNYSVYSLINSKLNIVSNLEVVLLYKKYMK